MIVLQNILSKGKIQSFMSDASFRCKLPFQVSPEVLKSVDVSSSVVRELILSVIHKSMDEAFGRNFCISCQHVGTYC